MEEVTGPEPEIFRIDPAGAVVPLTGTPTLADLQDAVGGYIEVVPLRPVLNTDTDPIVMVANEDGLRLKLPPNPVASLIAGQPIVGTVLVLPRRLLD